MDYLQLANVQQSKSESAPQITTKMIVINRLNYLTRPILNTIGWPLSQLLRFGSAIAEEGRRDLQESFKNEQLQVDKSRLRDIQIQQLRERATEETLSPRQIINRRNAAAPRKSKQTA